MSSDGAAAQIGPTAGGGRLAAAYAQGLLAAADGAGQTSDVIEELDSLLDDVLPATPDLQRLLIDGQAPHDQRVQLIDRLFGERASKTFVNFLKVTSERDRLGDLPAVRLAVREILDQRAGRVRVQVQTAAPLSENSRKLVAQQLRDKLQAEPVLQEVVTPELLGGLVVRVGDTVFDGSVASRLTRLRKQMVDKSIHEIQSRRDRFSSPTGD